MKKTLITMFGLMFLGAGVALAQFERQYTFEEVDTDGDGMISIEEAKSHPEFVNEAIHHTFKKAQGDKVKKDKEPMTIEQKEWEGLTAH